MLELAKPGSAGTGTGVIPVLRDGAVVALLRASNWREAGTATIGTQTWVLAKHRGDLTARWASDSEDVVRMRARQTSLWKGTWRVELEGTPVEVRSASRWKGTHRFLVDGKPVAESGTTGGWSPRPTLTAEPDLPVHHQVFLLWMELVLSRRNTAAITAATGAAVIGGSS
ncbi:hypothetical protein [Blastococcus deserti]|uniref:Uncharacterized protein n=1 Tax=Blastococcus deserti TaxID=2259033 RepID=A0ABW4XCJ2_9ACTN